MPVLNKMDLVNNIDLEALLAKRDGPCISLYMPAERMGAETRQNPIRFKNMLTQVENRLDDLQLSSEQREDLLTPLQQLRDDRVFWQEQSDGLAVFIAPGEFYTYRLPLEFEELVVVGARFHIKPLLPAFSLNQRFFILALSLNNVQLFQATEYSLGEIELEGVATSMTEALKLDDPEREAQFHTATTNPGSAGTRDAIFHGHAPDEDRKSDILRFFRAVDHGVADVLASERAPLVLVGVDYLHPLYHEANSYPHLINEGVEGNPDEFGSREFHARAWDNVKSHLDQNRDEAVNRYHALAAQSDQASDDVKIVLPAAVFGRVDTLFVERGVQLWGEFDPQANKVNVQDEHQPGNQDLLDMSAVHTIMNGGSVYVVESENMPDESAVAAVFRY